MGIFYFIFRQVRTGMGMMGKGGSDIFNTGKQNSSISFPFILLLFKNTDKIYRKITGQNLRLGSQS